VQCSIIPPYLLRNLSDAADDRELALVTRHTLDADNLLRDRRRAAPADAGPRTPTEDADRVIHTANNTETLPGEVARRSGEPATGDIAVDEAYDSSGQVWNLFAQVFDRRALDGSGTTVSVTVHYGVRYDNAFWDGTQLVFGDGDGIIFDRFTKPMDVMAHEFTHGVVQHSADLAYLGQAGALNESICDVFASMTKQWVRNQNAEESDWLIGEGLFLPGVAAVALRSLKEPGTAYDDPRLGKDPQVASMADYVETDEDNGGVHINSGIPNRAFVLACLDAGGYSWEQVGRVWYHALTAAEIGPDTDFVSFAQATASSSAELFGSGSPVTAAVRSAWTEVGVTPAAGSAPRETAGPLPVTRVAVRRTGGFAGMVRTGELDLLSDPAGEEVRHLLLSVDLHELMVSPPTPDRFVYTVEYGQNRLQVPEQDLTPELHRVVQIVLGE
jgi:hypothetical protein